MNINKIDKSRIYNRYNLEKYNLIFINENLIRSCRFEYMIDS